MGKTTWQDLAENMLQSADITINGSRAWDIQVHKPEFFERVFKYYSLGLGEAYMDGWWDCERVDEFIFRVINARLDEYVLTNKSFIVPILLLKLRTINASLFNRQSQTRSLEVGRMHYDIGNDLYTSMLDKNLNYTCGYWRNAQNLDDAQVAKMTLICEKLQLKPGMRLLDIGCGFGTLARFAAENYGVSVVGITISEQQKKLALEICKNLPIEIRFLDYRDLAEKFDRIVSVGMFEHVGYKNYALFMSVANKCLNSDGLFLLHTIGTRVSTIQMDPWVNRYIFPNSQLPSIAQIGKAIEPYFVMEDWHSFGLDYAKTLAAWHHNFTSNWPRLKNNYDHKFFRMWTYYLLSSAGGFKAKSNQLWQIVLSKPGRTESYVSNR